MKKIVFLLGCIISTTLGMHPSYACTDFRLTAKDHTVLITRSMEYAQDMQTNLRSSPRGRVFAMTAPNGKPGLTWKAKYGYLFLDAYNQEVALDGMNEAGLSFEALYLPNFAQYQTVPAKQESRALSYLAVGDWVLSNFKTVEEVRQAMTTVYVFNQPMPALGNTVFPLHYAVFDASGKGLIIEYVGGKLFLYDNVIGVLTNSPTYDWHITNLNNYVHLAPVNPPPVAINGITFAATGQGFGMIGLPGDVSPPSRFVKISVLKQVSLPGDHIAQTLNLAEHIINTVDIARGIVRNVENGAYYDETTQWVVFKDLTHKTLYYRTYQNMTLRGIVLSKIDFSEQAPRLKMPLATAEYAQDKTDQFLKSIPVTPPNVK